MVSVDQLRLILTLDDDNTICNLKSELPVYQAAVEDLPDDVNRLDWWSNQPRLASWVKATRIVLLIAPSSAAVECAFSCWKLAHQSTSKGFSKITSNFL